MVKKFIFNNNFGGQDVSSSELVHLTKANFEKQKKEAYDNGYIAGKLGAEKAAKDFYEQSLLKTITGLNSSIQKVIDDDITQRQQVIHNIVAISFKIFQKHFPVYLEKAGVQELEELICSTISTLKDSSDIVVNVHESYVEEVKKHIYNVQSFTNFKGNIQVKENINLKKGDCKIYWGNGGCERVLNDLTLQLQEDLNPILKLPNQTESKGGDNL